MKPCLRHRQSVALLADAALSAEESAATHRHLAACPSCREYFEQMSALCGEYRDAARQLPDAEAPLRLYRGITASVSAPSCPSRNPLVTGLAARRAWLSCTALVGLLLVGAWYWSRPSSPPSPLAGQPQPPLPHAPSPPDVAGVRLLTYRLALNRSSEALDELLTLNANVSASSSPSSTRPGLTAKDLDL